MMTILKIMHGKDYSKYRENNNNNFLVNLEGFVRVTNRKNVKIFVRYVAAILITFVLLNNNVEVTKTVRFRYSVIQGVFRVI